MDAVDRINLLIKIEDVSRPKLAELTGLKKERWQNVLKRQAKLYQEDTEALFRVWPEYAYWIATGLELPDAGQISPMTKKAHEASKTAPGAG